MRTPVALALLLLASALVLVNTSYESRRLYTELDQARALALALDTELKRLDVQRQAQATNLRVEKAARERLDMRTATPAVTHYLAATASEVRP